MKHLCYRHLAVTKDEVLGCNGCGAICLVLEGTYDVHALLSCGSFQR